MLQIASVLFFSLTFPASLLAVNAKDYKSIYFKSLRCNASEKIVFQNYSCFAKSYNRDVSTLNMIVTTKYPLFNMTVSDCLLFYQTLVVKLNFPFL